MNIHITNHEARKYVRMIRNALMDVFDRKSEHDVFSQRDLVDVSIAEDEIKLIDHIQEPFKRAAEMKQKYPLWK